MWPTKTCDTNNQTMGSQLKWEAAIIHWLLKLMHKPAVSWKAPQWLRWLRLIHHNPHSTSSRESPLAFTSTPSLTYLSHPSVCHALAIAPANSGNFLRGSPHLAAYLATPGVQQDGKLWTPLEADIKKRCHLFISSHLQFMFRMTREMVVLHNDKWLLASIHGFQGGVHCRNDRSTRSTHQAQVDWPWQKHVAWPTR